MNRNQVNIYCDESRHTSGGDRFMVIGAVLCDREKKREYVHQIHLLKKKHHAQGEFGWKRLSPNKQDFYFELIDFFMEKDIGFKCIVVDRNRVDNETYNDGDSELGFYKFYYQMLKDSLEANNEYYIYLDWQQNRDQHRFSTLKFYLQQKLQGRAKIACLEPVTSTNQPLIELADLFIGAVGYQYNNRRSSPVKTAFCTKLADALHERNNRYFKFHRLDTFTAKTEKKFNIFRWEPRN